MTDLGSVLRSERERRGLGQEQLAHLLGVKQQTVSRWEQGLALPRATRIADLARVLAMEPASLHRLAGYLPPEGASSALPPQWQALRAELSTLSDSALVELVDSAWRELRTRDATTLG